MKPEQERLTTVLKDTISLLCKNSLSFEKQVIVQGVIAITVDKDDVLVVQVNDFMGQPNYDPCVACGHTRPKPPEEVVKETSRKRAHSPSSRNSTASPTKNARKSHPSSVDDAGESDQQSDTGGGEEEAEDDVGGGYELLPIKKEELEGDDDDLVLIGEELKSDPPPATLTSGNYLDNNDSSSDLNFAQHDNQGQGGDGGYITGYMQNTQIMAVGSGSSQTPQQQSQADMSLSPGSWTPGGSGDPSQQSTVVLDQSQMYPNGNRRRPFGCPWPNCYQRFFSKSNQRVHLRRHTGEKPYSCRLCSFTARQLVQLQRHMHFHENIATGGK